MRPSVGNASVYTHITTWCSLVQSEIRSTWAFSAQLGLNVHEVAHLDLK